MEVDEFTEQLMERAKVRKEYLRKKMSEMRKRAALSEENQIAETCGNNEDDSPKRQRLLESTENLKEHTNFQNEDNEESSEMEDGDDKENAPIIDSSFVPFKTSGARGLAALRKGTQISSAEHQGNERCYEDTSDERKECQGYVKSESTSRLIYDFKEKPSQEIEKTSAAVCSVKQTESCQHSDSAGKNSSSPIKVQPQPVPESNRINKAENGIIDSIADPAELPLSARKALFEKALHQGSNKHGMDVLDQNLSVAQRAALFEQASKGPIKRDGQKNFLKEPQRFSNDNTSPLRSPVKFGESRSPLKHTELKSPAKLMPNLERKQNLSPMKSMAPCSPSKMALSPSKNAGVHTRLVQQKLIDNSANDWRKKDIVAKASNERKTEISSLLNHWEKMSSVNYEVSRVQAPDIKKRSVSSGSDKFDTVFEECEESDKEDAIAESKEDESEIEADSEGEDAEEEEDDENRACGHVTGRGFEFIKYIDDDENEDEVAVDDIIDEAMDEALKDERVMPPPPPPIVPSAVTDPNIVKTSSKNSSVSTNGSFGSSMSQESHSSDPHVSQESHSSDPHVSQESHSSDQRLSSDNTAANCFSSQSSDDSEISLMHTVSFYRRQKQQKRAAPMRTIVRKETVSSPPSPEQDRTNEIRERVKALQDEVLAQQTVISQTSQALNLCLATEEFSGSTEQVECERLLLISTQRRQACINEMQRLKSSLTTGKKLVDGSGTLILNDIRLPLKQDFINSQKGGKNCDDVHYFICLVRHNHQVIVTQMLAAQDGVQQGSLSFTNHITVHELPPDFSVAFEVYTLRTKKEVLPHDRKYHIKKDHSKLRLTPKGKKGDSKLLSPIITSPGGPNAVRSPNFSVVGFTRFTIQNCNRQIYTLEKVPFSSPLEGVLKLNMHLRAEHKIVERGFLTMFEDVSGFGAWHRRWCLLHGKNVAFWKYPDDEKRKEPMLVINLKQCITNQVKLVSRDVCARPHTFELLTVRPQAEGDKNTLITRSLNTLTTTKYLLSADTKEERILWCNRLNDALTNVRKWDPEALKPIDLKQDK